VANERDTSAVAAGYAALQTRLLRYLRATAGEAAEDIASQVWLEVVANTDGIGESEEDLRRRVFMIARSRAIDHGRRWWQRRVVVRSPDHPGWERSVGNGDDPGGEDTRAAVALIAGLPRPQAEVVLLRVIAGLSAEEVAAITSRSPSAVRVMQHRALRRLRRDLQSDSGRREV
jgi:RNA polymerase sigma-70 factor (ECF subfamily)